MTYKQIPENTFGGSPAAMYLVRELNSLQNEAMLRSVGKRITATAKQIQELHTAFSSSEQISAKTFANCLRLMRKDITDNMKLTESKDVNFIDHLRSNVQIGLIKRAMRLTSITRKAETVMASPDKKGVCMHDPKQFRIPAGYEHYSYLFKDSVSGVHMKAGGKYVSKIESDLEPLLYVNKFESDDIDEVTNEILHARSNKRCARLNKAHMIC